MNHVICTLFEGHYHYGVAALANSLYANGYRGSIYAGYRGEIPRWATEVVSGHQSSWPGSTTFKVAEELLIHFLPIDTDYHLTNYKPYFMFHLMNSYITQAKGIAYFDPDIVIKCNWSFFELWINSGVALVHEVANDPMPATHPIRLAWLEVLDKMNRKSLNKLDHYFNAGFCGVKRNDIEFLETWYKVIDTAIKYFEFNPSVFNKKSDRLYLFEANDQDAMNIAAMCTTTKISEVGPDGMDFTNGGWIMSHATGSTKPWKSNFIVNALKGITPSIASRNYWKHVNSPIAVFTPMHTQAKLLSIKISSFIGRFYSR
ncbi:hypothetical protein [Hymenobacter norwichensis]|uniref:hypothetical protein n=1 Tax=Hymenobacter norwichensis TaxID=223903 RepID=UPI00040136E6|nr:hypothetical protein [Hymenobacter norwichensis]